MIKPWHPEKEQWIKSIEQEHDNMKANNVWKPVHLEDIENDATILSSKWVMKREANGVFKARLTAKGFEQRDGEHYDEHDKSSPVVSDITIRMVFVLMDMGKLYAELVDVKGAFLTASFEDHHKMYVDVPSGFEKYYPQGVVLLLLRTLYGTKQAAIQFGRNFAQS
jgi:hypothetical protein